MSDDSEDFDEVNKKILEEDLANASVYDSEEESESTSADDESQEQETSDSDNVEEEKAKPTRKKSSFDPEKNKRTVFIGNISLETTEKVCYVS